MMNTPSKHRSIGSLMASLFFVLVGFVVLYDTAHYADQDSQVFPRAAAIFLIVSAGISCVIWVLKGDHSEGFGKGIWWRRTLLVLTMLMAGFAMPYIGFLPAGAIAFAGGLIAAMHHRWTAQKLVLYTVLGVVVMVSFYALFKYGLYVPLP